MWGIHKPKALEEGRASGESIDCFLTQLGQTKNISIYWGVYNNR